MITIKTEADIAILRQGGKRLARLLQALSKKVAPGVTPKDLDLLARQIIKEGGDLPAFLNYQPAGASQPFPAALCVSVNDEVVHGIPSDKPLQDGDIVSLDCGLNHRDRFTDMAITVPVNQVSPQLQTLIKITEEALLAGIKVARAGHTTGDIGVAIATIARRHNYGLVRELGGHGVGFEVHEDPEIPNYGRRGRGVVLKSGMVIAIEPMFNLGQGAVKFLDDGYTVKTIDGLPSAHFEHTVLITDAEPEILTSL